jgi:hypothetical protein
MCSVNGVDSATVSPRIGANNGILHSIEYNRPITTYLGKNCSIADSTVYWSGTATTFSSSYNLLLFTVITGGTIDDRKFYGRLYRCKL